MNKNILKRVAHNYISYKPGDIIGNFVYVSEAESLPNIRKVNLKCSCGNVFATRVNSAKKKLKSCGCYQRKHGNNPSFTHGMSNTSEYKSWSHMKARCCNPSDKKYSDYGGRGIAVCDRWRESFENFYEDMGDKPTTKHSIERNDVNGPYSPENCRWATDLEQANNKRNNIILYFDGRSMTLSMWCQELGLSQRFVRSRLGAGCSDEVALTSVSKRNNFKNKLTYPWIKAI